MTKLPLLFTLFLSISEASLAQAPAIIKAENQAAYSPSTKRNIRVYAKSECEATISEFLEPRAQIQAGLRALGNLDRQEAPTCAEALGRNWEEAVRSPAELRQARARKEISDAYYEAKAVASSLIDKLNCLNSHAAGSEAAHLWETRNGKYCKDGFTKPSEAAPLRKKLEAANFKRDELSLEFFADSDLSELAAHLFLPESKQLKAEERYALVDALIAQLNEKDSPFALPNRDRLMELSQRYHCAQPYLSENPAARALFCKKRSMASSADLENIKADLKNALPDPVETAKQWQRNQNERIRVRNENLKKSATDADEQYGIRRLLARYSHYASGNLLSPEKLRKFCAENESIQQADVEFAKTFNLNFFESEAEWRWMSQHGLTESELSAVKLYSGIYYSSINSAIWDAKMVGKAPPEKESKLIETLKRALSHAPAYRQSPLLRYSALPGEVLDQHQTGAIVTYDAFTSTSKKKDWSYNGGKEGSAHGFLIYPGKSATAIDELSFNKEEEEVLFRPGTRFKVLSRTPRKHSEGVFDFVMAEVDEAGNVIAKIPSAKGAK